jgi:hypothetical protein
MSKDLEKTRRTAEYCNQRKKRALGILGYATYHQLHHIQHGRGNISEKNRRGDFSANRAMKVSEDHPNSSI